MKSIHAHNDPYLYDQVAVMVCAWSAFRDSGDPMLFADADPVTWRSEGTANSLRPKAGCGGAAAYRSLHNNIDGPARSICRLN